MVLSGKSGKSSTSMVGWVFHIYVRLQKGSYPGASWGYSYNNLAIYECQTLLTVIWLLFTFFFGYMDFIHCSIASFRRDSLWSLNSLLCKIHMNIVGKSVTSTAWPGAKYWGHGFRPLRTAGACHCLALCSPVDAKWWAGPVTPGAPPLTLPQRGHNFGPSTSQFCVQCGAPQVISWYSH